MGGKASKWRMWRSARTYSLTPEGVQRLLRVQTARSSAEYLEPEDQSITLSSMAQRIGLDKRRRKAFYAMSESNRGLGLWLEWCDSLPGRLINELQKT